MNKDVQDNIIYLERLLEARLAEDQYEIFLNKTQMNVDIKGTNYRFYTSCTKSTKARLFFYCLGGKLEDEFKLRDIVGRVDRKFRLWSNIDESQCHANQVAMGGIMLENIPQVIKKITEIATKEVA